MTLPMLHAKIQKRLPEYSLDVTFSAAADYPLAILGPSGAGKSMLLRCIAGMEKPDRGEITLNGRTLFNSTSCTNLPARERRIALLFQDGALFPHRTVAGNIAFGLHDLSEDHRDARVRLWADRTHIAGLEHRFPRELSGGEQQRVALARALAPEPELLLLDEPLTALDTHLRSQLEAQLQETFSEFRRPVLFVTHNMEEAYRLGSRILVLHRGRPVAYGPKEDVFRHPPTQVAAQITGCKNISVVQPLNEREVDVPRWRCTLKVGPDSNPHGRPPAFVGIRAHHLEFGSIDFSEVYPQAEGEENVFSCWPTRISETPFRVTLFLHLHNEPVNDAGYHLQAELPREKWHLLSARPHPWRIRLASYNLFLMPE